MKIFANKFILEVVYIISAAVPFGLFTKFTIDNYQNQMSVAEFTLRMALVVLSGISFIFVSKISAAYRKKP